MRLVKHLLEGKGGAIHWIGPEQPVLDAIRMMADKYVGALLVDGWRVNWSASFPNATTHARSFSKGVHRRIRQCAKS